MNSINSNLLIQILSLVLGSGAVQLGIFLFRRRGELRKLDTESAVNTSTAAVNYSQATDTLMQRLLADGERYRTITDTLQTTVERLQKAAVDAQRDFAQQLDVAHTENGRLVTRVAQLSTDLDITTRQLRDLTGRDSRDPLTKEY